MNSVSYNYHMHRKRYLFFDIDGTLVAGGYEHGYVPDSASLALDKLRKAGHFLCLCTGRSEALAVSYMHQMGFENMISDGGYGITIDGKLLGIQPLPKDKVIRLVRECEEKGFSWGIQPDNSDTRLAPNGRFEAITHDRYMKTKVQPGLDPEAFEEIYKAYIACFPGEEEQIGTLRDLPWCRFHQEYIFIEPSDKSYGIKKVLELMGADLSDAVVFGDSKNDLSMFHDPWTKVAMGNAIPELKELADYITANAEDDGIYKACEELNLF